MSVLISFSKASFNFLLHEVSQVPWIPWSFNLRLSAVIQNNIFFYILLYKISELKHFMKVLPTTTDGK